MIAPLVLFLLSVAALAWSAGVPVLSDVFAIALLAAVASLYLLVRAAVRRKKGPKRYVVIDGSNVMHWRD
ncbi:MAG: NYN domain-containing protein, partial [Paracoccaceae bacterium]